MAYGACGRRVAEGSGGYYTTLSGRILDPDTEGKNLGLGDMSEVVFQRRLRGDGLGSAGGVYNGGVTIPGEWTCSVCFAPHCWSARRSCCKCATPQINGGELPSGQGGAQARRGGFQGQGDDGAGMSGMRIVGPKGVISCTPQEGGDPTFRQEG